MNLALLIGVCCAVLFHRAAYHEHMSPWAWSISSLALSVVISMKTGSTTILLLVQAGLFALMWGYNVGRQGRGNR